MSGVAVAVSTNFKSALEKCGFSDDYGGTLMDQGIRIVEDLSLTAMELLKAT